MEGTIDRKGVCRVKKAASLSLRRSTLLAGSLAAALACSVAPAGAASPAPDPSPPASAPHPDPVPGSVPTRATAVRQTAAPAAPQPATRSTAAPVANAPAPAAKRPPKPTPGAEPKARPAPEPRRATLDLAARIDHSLPASVAAIATGTDQTLLASLGLFALVLASSSLLWLLHIRAEALR